MQIRILTIIMVFLLSFAPEAKGGIKSKTKWKEHKSNHFIIYYKNAPVGFVENVKKMAEQYYKEIATDLGFTRYKGWTFNRRAKIYIYDNQEDYVTSARQLGWSHGVANARKKEIWTFPTAHGFFDSTLPHELGHIIFREFIGFQVQVPLWLDEGVAMYQEKAKRWGANDAVRQAIKTGKFIPLRELSITRLYSNTPRDLVDLFYAESASIVYYMITELGEHRFVRFCRKLRKGQSFNSALSSVYPRFKTIDKLNKSWLNYLEQ